MRWLDDAVTTTRSRCLPRAALLPLPCSYSIFLSEGELNSPSCDRYTGMPGALRDARGRGYGATVGDATKVGQRRRLRITRETTWSFGSTTTWPPSTETFAQPSSKFTERRGQCSSKQDSFRNGDERKPSVFETTTRIRRVEQVHLAEYRIASKVPGQRVGECLRRSIFMRGAKGKYSTVKTRPANG